MRLADFEGGVATIGREAYERQSACEVSRWARITRHWTRQHLADIKALSAHYGPGTGVNAGKSYTAVAGADVDEVMASIKRIRFAHRVNQVRALFDPAVKQGLAWDARYAELDCITHPHGGGNA